VKRIPIRLRLTLGFTATVAVVLSATGLFLYLHLRSDLDQAIARGLRSRTGDVSALVQQADTGLRDAARSSRSPSADLAQILDDRGRVFDATAGLTRRPLLTPERLPRGSHPSMVERTAVPEAGGPARLLATPVHAQGRRLVVVVVASLRDRDRALADLLRLLVIGGPAALLLASLAGYALAAAALRPVESMRRRAAVISAEDLTRRLPLPPAEDELQRLGQTLNEMLDRLEHGLARERTFTADASHELRTPLTVLRTELELIARDRPSGQRLSVAIDDAVEETARLTRLVDDMLVLARTERDGPSIATQALPVTSVLAAVKARFAALNDRRLITVHAPDDLRVRADPDLLQRMLTNMLDNAIRYGVGSIELRARAVGRVVELHVLDRGPGFPDAFLPHAFERFRRAQEKTSGTGLGLAIVEDIARRHGGSAHVANRRDGGADVWVTMPAAVLPAGPPAGASDLRTLSAPCHRSTKTSI
jgi:two-component system OmpR family sensor kinase